MLKRMLKKFRSFVKWHLPTTVATMKKLEEHFNFTEGEMDMLHACTVHHLLKEYVCFNDDRTEAYIVINVSQARKLIKMRRKNEKR